MRVSLSCREPDPGGLGSTEGAAGYFTYRVTRHLSGEIDAGAGSSNLRRAKRRLPTRRQAARVTTQEGPQPHRSTSSGGALGAAMDWPVVPGRAQDEAAEVQPSVAWILECEDVCLHVAEGRLGLAAGALRKRFD